MGVAARKGAAPASKGKNAGNTDVMGKKPASRGKTPEKDRNAVSAAKQIMPEKDKSYARNAVPAAKEITQEKKVGNTGVKGKKNAKKKEALHRRQRKMPEKIAVKPEMPPRSQRYRTP